MVTVSHLRAIAGAKTAAPMMDKLAAAFNRHAPEYGVTTQKRVAQFLANVCHETGGFRVLEENLNYTPEGLVSTFSRSRISAADAAKYGRTKSRKADQRAIANIIYGGPWGKKNLGNTEPDDGWNFRGSGPGQVTGRANFARVQEETGMQVLANPNLLRDPDNGMKAALALWQKWGLNEMADADQTDAIRKRWNGGTLGLDEVRAAFARAMRLTLALDGKPAPIVPAAPPQAELTDAKLIEKVQQLLRDKGYPEVGNVDNKMGSRTRNAILAFEADNGMPLTGAVSDALLVALIKAPVRQNSAARENATAADLKDATSVKIGGTLQKVGVGLFAASGLGGLAEGAGNIDDVVNGVNKIRALGDVLLSISPWIIGAVAGGIALYFGSKFIKEQVQAYREGRHV